MTYHTLITHYPGICYILIGLLALLVGSLLNVFIYRLPQMLKAQWHNDCCCLLKHQESLLPVSLNLFFPRSFCPACNHTIAAWYNIPVLSYIWLKGQCYYCHRPIAARYPLIEILCAALSLLAAWYFGLTATFVAALLFIWIVIILFFIDIDHQLLPDCLTLSLLWLGLIANQYGFFISLSSALTGAIAGYLSLWIFVNLFYLITGKSGMGYGDIKLFAAFGAWFGYELLPFILIFSSLTGAIIGIIYLHINKKNRDTPIAFGPFLCGSGLIALFWGELILSWHLFIY